MKIVKVAKHKARYISFLAPIASKSIKILYGTGEIYDNEWRKFYTSVHKTARYGGENWKYKVEELIINLSK